MDELKVNPNQLSEKLKGRVPRMTIYDFLTGKTDARTEVVAEIMKALGLEIVVQKSKKRAR
jgi:DNA-binding phage protein